MYLKGRVLFNSVSARCITYVIRISVCVIRSGQQVTEQQATDSGIVPALGQLSYRRKVRVCRSMQVREEVCRNRPLLACVQSAHGLEKVASEVATTTGRHPRVTLADATMESSK